MLFGEVVSIPAQGMRKCWVEAFVLQSLSFSCHDVVARNAGLVVFCYSQRRLENVGSNHGELYCIGDSWVCVRIGACVIDFLQGGREFSSYASPLDGFEVVVLKEDDKGCCLQEGDV